MEPPLNLNAILIERYGQQVVVRSRGCPRVLPSSSTSPPAFEDSKLCSACACAFLPGVVDAAHNSGLVGEVGKKEEEREEEEEEEDGSPASDCDEEEEEGVEQQAKEEEKEEEEESAEDTGRI